MDFAKIVDRAVDGIKYVSTFDDAPLEKVEAALDHIIAEAKKVKAAVSGDRKARAEAQVARDAELEAIRKANAAEKPAE